VAPTVLSFAPTNGLAVEALRDLDIGQGWTEANVLNQIQQVPKQKKKKKTEEKARRQEEEEEEETRSACYASPNPLSFARYSFFFSFACVCV
jgi:hypothetical protein